MAKLTFFQLLKAAEQQLQAAGQDTSAAQYLLLEGRQWTFTTLIQHYRDAVPAELAATYQSQIKRVCAGEPAQYILGCAPFYGREFLVTPATLIPRQETEELVEWVLSTTKPTADLLDVGTGSGAIAISIKAERPDWAVTATDVSVAAVTVAQQNAQRLQAPVTFAVGDLLEPVQGQRFDIVVSNPPYIDRAELPVMDDSVKRYEPDSALFADDHGLAFYRRFAAKLTTVLRPAGQFFAEIGYQQGAAVRDIFATALPGATVTVKTDINGHDRMVRVQLKS
ncbi:methylase of polypeptide chain release factor [Levilactobacillus koreensis JCM 16448]|uniref:Release factor glutamine methyltransferase n=1 Tax=Levilactobacillus koreensis TaxID=637971 RepID=A0AAC8UUK2_9LACO|nr:peptide chain release factor N(5)-glutamine methyltransferase [Levilactobacillus koreensis]AKP63709.1 protein-(glutamine-N5) methyltransferase [Levilactobacillus koreensis]KRK89285.1 methylase of polypeptide chain release factor [Levilactobacillus koreensis JCM 16448]